MEHTEEETEKGEERRKGAEWHGAIITATSVISYAFLPARMQVWPFPFLIPLLLYFAIVFPIPRLRASMAWGRWGSLKKRGIVAAVAILIATSACIVSFQWIVRPDLGYLHRSLPVSFFGGFLLFGTVFSMVNAILEEAIFRGILFDAIDSSWGPLAAVASTAICFGIIHQEGYPPGAIGMVLASAYGLALGWLRLSTGGLAAPIAVHAFADATIVGILAAS